MINAEEIFEEVKQSLINIGIPVKKSRLAYRRFTVTYGECYYFPKEKIYEIRVAKRVCNEENLDLLKTIIAHELLHTCDVKTNHKGDWLKYAEKADELLDYRILEKYELSQKESLVIPVDTTKKVTKRNKIQ